MELAACGARVVIAGRRAEVLEAAVGADRRARELIAGDIREPADAEADRRRGARAPRAARHARQQRRGPVLRARRGDRAQGLAGGDAPERRRDARTWRRRAGARAMRPAGGGTIVNVTLSPHHGLAGMAHSSAARAAVEGLTRELARPNGPATGSRSSAVAAGPLRHRGRCASTPSRSGARRPRTVPLQRLGTRGRARLAGRAAGLAAGPLAQRRRGDARRRPRQLVRPLAAAQPGRRRGRRPHRGTVRTAPRGYHPQRLAGEVLWLHRSLPSF